MIKKDSRTVEGIKLCEEILKDSESSNPDYSVILKKTIRLAHLLNKEEEFSWVKDELEKESSPFGISPLFRLEYVKSRINLIHTIITKQWVELRFNGLIVTIFEETKKLVDSKIVDICPDAIEKFTVSYERLTETNPESWAQSVTTCRRILNDFADAIYPPQNTLIKGRKVGENEYINRLWAFASENIESDTNKKLIQSEVDYIGGIIDSLYDLTCKGTHAEITKDEAERVVVRTYFLISDLIKLGSL